MLLSLPFQLSGFEVTRVLSTQTRVVVFARACHPTAQCPHCQQLSKCIHSYYQRKAQDLPISGKIVQVILSVRRFRCANPGCPSVTFVERVPGVIASHKQRTTRLLSALSHVAAEMSGDLGARVLRPLGIVVSPDTLLRLTKLPPPRLSELPKQSELMILPFIVAAPTG